jgi:hypothetical protein
MTQLEIYKITNSSTKNDAIIKLKIQCCTQPVKLTFVTSTDVDEYQIIVYEHD